MSGNQRHRLASETEEERAARLQHECQRQDDNTSLKAVQKFLINCVGERDYLAQETCHLLLQLPLFRASRDFIMLSLDGSRAVEDRFDENQPATAVST